MSTKTNWKRKLGSKRSQGIITPKRPKPFRIEHTMVGFKKPGDK